MAAANQRSRDAAGIEEVVTADGMARDYAHLVNCDLERDLLVVEHDGIDRRVRPRRVARPGGRDPRLHRRRDARPRPRRIRARRADARSGPRTGRSPRLGRSRSPSVGRVPSARISFGAEVALAAASRSDWLDPVRPRVRDGPPHPRGHPGRADAGRPRGPPDRARPRGPPTGLGRGDGGVPRRARRIGADRGGVGGVPRRSARGSVALAHRLRRRRDRRRRAWTDRPRGERPPRTRARTRVGGLHPSRVAPSRPRQSPDRALPGPPPRTRDDQRLPGRRRPQPEPGDGSLLVARVRGRQHHLRLDQAAARGRRPRDDARARLWRRRDRHRPTTRPGPACHAGPDPAPVP